MAANETIAWIEQEADSPDAFYCFKASDGVIVRWLILELRLRPTGGPVGGEIVFDRPPLRVVE